MALKLKKDSPYSSTGVEYWKISETNINWGAKTSHVVLSGFVSREERDAKKLPVLTQFFDWSGEQFPFDLNKLDRENENVVKTAYIKIKAEEADLMGNPNEWKQAIDC